MNRSEQVVASVALMLGAILGACANGDTTSSRDVATIAPPDTALLDSLPTCASCSVRVVDSVVIGSVNDSLIPVRVPGFARDSRGTHYLTFDGWGNQPILRYDAAGRFLGRFSRLGRGPGEYRMTSRVFVGPGDSLMVLDWDRRAQLFTPEGKYARGMIVHSIDAIGVAAAGVVGAAPVGAAAVGATRLYTLSRYSRVEPLPASVSWIDHEGTVRDSFTVFSPVIRRFPGGPVMRVQSGNLSREVEPRMRPAGTVGRNGMVWTYSNHNYRLEGHDAQGVARKLYGVRVAGALPPIMTEADMDSAFASRRHIPTSVTVRSERSPAYLQPTMWVDVDSAGLLWVARQMPAPSWDTIRVKGEKLSPNEAPTEVTFPRDAEDRFYHTMIEIIDPRLGQMIARLELPFKGERVGAGFVGRVTANDDGFFIPIVYRLSLMR